ncbi:MULTISPECIES: hypothetical protein [unclassified Pseudomonas]|uniref:hypothetical protein n=1 Tax=unclassified Pseudomonas TaxID=196821 RepID=UPI002115C37E|nr:MULTISPECIES: hypothetical protein [unclassified Pseudomonas]
MSLLNRQYESVTATLTCGLFDLLGTAHPREQLIPSVAPDFSTYEPYQQVPVSPL